MRSLLEARCDLGLQKPISAANATQLALYS